MSISVRHYALVAALCSVFVAACTSTPSTQGSTSSSSAASSGSGGEGGMAGSGGGGMGGSAGSGMGGTGGVGGSGMGGAGGGNSFSASGSVNAPNIPADSKLIVVWSVSSGSPDYIYKWGDGTTDGVKFTVTLLGDPPPAAINAGFAGVGYLLVVQSNYVVPEGQLTSTQATELENSIIAYSAQHAIIFHPNTSQSPYPWSPQFSNGYQCAKCVPMGGTFDHWAPTNCSDIVLVDPSQPSCNWT